MLDPKGNTAVYLLYAYARICSIIRKGGDEAIQRALQSRIEIGHQKERALALTLARLPDTLE